MADNYQQVLREMAQEVLDEIIDDAVGIGEWKKKRQLVEILKNYGTGEFPSESSDSPLSTFS